jgi:hypothetical protein
VRRSARRPPLDDSPGSRCGTLPRFDQPGLQMGVDLFSPGRNLLLSYTIAQFLKLLIRSQDYRGLAPRMPPSGTEGFCLMVIRYRMHGVSLLPYLTTFTFLFVPFRLGTASRLPRQPAISDRDGDHRFLS